MAKKIRLSLIIPAFNEEYRNLKSFEKNYKFLKSEIKDFEIIFVNDGSTDNTEEILRKFSKNYPNVYLITYKKNQGKGFAVKQGVKKAKGEVIGFTDADFAISLKDIKLIIEEIKNGIDIVIGNRKSSQARLENSPVITRKVLSFLHAKINNFFLNLGPIYDTLCGFKFFKKDVAKDLFSRVSIYRWFFDLELLILARKKKYQIIQTPVFWKDIRGSKVSLKKDAISLIKDHVNIYLTFFNIKIFSFIHSFLVLLILFPFLINPSNLVLRNGDFSDLVWPNYYFIKDSFLNNQELPLWNPNIFSGIPEIANPQSPLLYPPNIIALYLPIDISIVILIALHVWICGIFVFLAARKLNFSNLASVLTSLAISFSPYFWSKVSVGHLSMSFALFLLGPIIYLAISEIKKKSLLNIFLLSLVLSFQYLNYPTIWFYTCLFGGVSVVGLTIFRDIRKFKLILILAPIISLLLIAPIFLLQLQASEYITRASLSLAELSVPIWSIKRFLGSIFIPSNFLGDLETEVWLYPSLLLLISAFFGWIKLKKNLKIIIALIIGLVLFITLGSRTPVYQFLVLNIPGFSYLRVTTRDYFVFIVIISFLAGFFVDNTRFRFKNVLLIFIILDLYFFSLLRLWNIPKIMQPFTNVDLSTLLIVDQNYRYYCTNRCLSLRDSLPFGINSADGYHLLILKLYQEEISKAAGFNPGKYTGNIPSYETGEAQPDANKLGNFAVKYLISKYPLLDPNFTPLRETSGYILYENTKALPRIRFENKFNNSIKIINISPNQIEVETLGEADKLILADTYYPGWEVWVDGKQTKIIMYASWARSTEIESGAHRVVFKYSPFSNFLNYENK